MDVGHHTPVVTGVWCIDWVLPMDTEVPFIFTENKKLVILSRTLSHCAKLFTVSQVTSLPILPATALSRQICIKVSQVKNVKFPAIHLGHLTNEWPGATSSQNRADYMRPSATNLLLSVYHKISVPRGTISHAYIKKGHTHIQVFPVPNAYTNSFVISSCIICILSANCN